VRVENGALTAHHLGYLRVRTMRWYKNETSGWMHDSTVEFLTPEAKLDAK